MVLKAGAMSTYESEQMDEAWHLLRKLFLLLLVVTAAALGLVLLSRQRSSIPPVLFNLLADASLGLLVGLATRFALNNRHSVIQWLASAAVSLVGLALLGYLTNWRSGIGPFQAGLVTVHWLNAIRIPIPLRLPLEFGRSGMDITDLVHAVVAVDTSWIALRVWKQTPHASGSVPAPAPRMRRPARSRSPRAADLPAAAPVMQVVPVVPSPRAPASAGSSARARIKRKKAERGLVSRPAPAIRPMRSKPRHSSLRHGNRPAVHIAVHEEHRCPYCLEPVSRNDPRGTVECQICHTLHHKDCWDITGNCQVPHLTT
jgi:hypothetical protein